MMNTVNIIQRTAPVSEIINMCNLTAFCLKKLITNEVGNYE